MIDHITIEVADLEKSKLFYERAFVPLGYRLSFGKEGVFWAFDVGNGCLSRSSEPARRRRSPICMLPSASAASQRSMRSSSRRWQPAPKTMAHPARVPTMR